MPDYHWVISLDYMIISGPFINNITNEEKLELALHSRWVIGTLFLWDWETLIIYIGLKIVKATIIILFF